MAYTFAEVRKAALTALGVAAQVITVALAIGGIIPAGWPLLVGTLIVGVAQVYGVFKAPNAAPYGTGAPDVVSHRATGL